MLFPLLLVSCGGNPSQSVVATGLSAEESEKSQDQEAVSESKNQVLVSKLDLGTDLSNTIIRPVQMFLFDDGEEFDKNMPEPLGFLGNEYERFYIHYDIVYQLEKGRYQVKGKTKFLDNIRAIAGEIIVDSIVPHIQVSAIDCELGGMAPFVEGDETGTIYAHYSFSEARDEVPVGKYVGKAMFDYALHKGNLYYDATNLIADGYCNNQYEGVWVSLDNDDEIICNWGDYRIPNSGPLDIGCAEFYPNEEAQKNHGWANYNQPDKLWWK